MALYTGHDCDLTIGSTSYASVVNGFELKFDSTATEYQTLDGPKAGPGSETGSLSITFAWDGFGTGTLSKALWDATDAGTPVEYVVQIGTVTLSGDAVAVRPSIPATAGEVVEVQVELPLDGIPTPGTAA